VVRTTKDRRVWLGRADHQAHPNKEIHMMKSQGIVIASLAVAFLTGMALAAHAQTADCREAAPVCWGRASATLAVRTGEDVIHKNVAEALVMPPQRAMKFTSVPQRGVVRRVDLPPGSKKLVALTFDLCEQPDEVAGYQGGIVDYLRQEGVRATFFAGGKWMLTHHDRSEQLLSDPQFEVANHSWEHRNLRLLKGQKLYDEIRDASLAYEQVREGLEAEQCTWPGRGAPVRGKELQLFRFPFGACDPESLKAVANSGMMAVQWDVSSGDPSPGLSPELMERDVVGAVKPGSIVLFHANGRGWHTQSALPKIVARLRADGYEFATVSELLKAGKPEFAPVCYDVRRGDTNHYDDLGRRLEARYEAFKTARKVAAAGSNGFPADADLQTVPPHTLHTAPLPRRRPAAADLR
jgi:peptidoglycan-N-acetylglucosamine deacetylase